MQLGCGLIFTPATISSLLAALPPTVPVTRFDSLRLFATISLHIAIGSPALDDASSPSLRTPSAAASALAEPPDGASSSIPFAGGSFLGPAEL